MTTNAPVGPEQGLFKVIIGGGLITGLSRSRVQIGGFAHETMANGTFAGVFRLVVATYRRLRCCIQVAKV